MRSSFYLLSIVVLFSACTPSKQVTVESKQAELQIEKRSTFLIRFASEEDVKRIPYRFQNLKMQLEKEISSSDHIYQVSILCRPLELEGNVMKIGNEQGVVWAKLED
ncbi:MAG: hypothetical protein K9J17_05595 [Flavobacteriales bacterium]|nr:hypothetical protein [Flavobacteriales bacterium]